MSEGYGRTRERLEVTEPYLCGYLYDTRTDFHINQNHLGGTPYFYGRVDDFLHKGPPYRTGDDWVLSRSTSTISRDPSSLNHFGDYKKSLYIGYYGGFNFSKAARLADLDEVTAIPIPGISAEEYARLANGKTSAGLAQFIAELRDVPRMLQSDLWNFCKIWKYLGGWGPRRGFGPRSVADAFLNHQFGWVPFLSDLEKFNRAFINTDKRMDRLRRENGRWTRRKIDFGTVTTQEVIQATTNNKTSMYPVLPTYYYKTPYYTEKIVKETTQHRWATGKFRFYIPDNGRNDYTNALYRHMWGLEVNPLLLWELTPWSWLIDWFSNMGHVIENFSRALTDHVVSKNLCAMVHYKVQYQYEEMQNLFSGPLYSTHYLTQEVKRRDYSVHPFSFELVDAALSIRQKWILMALGIAQSPRIASR